MNFEILRDMEGFTQQMLNNIIGFQERDHPAWNENLSFSQRIKDIPLHYLIFSNADRNPETHGPTIAHYYPLRWELQTIARYAKVVGKKPIVHDVYARNGFVGSLLAREGVKVIGWRNPGDKPNQVENLFDPDNYDLRLSNFDAGAEPVDVIYANWAPPGINDTQIFLSHSPKLIVYTFTRHRNEHDQSPQTGTETSFGEELADDYKLVDSWNIKRRENLLHGIWPDLTPNIEETRTTRVYAHKDFDKSLFKRIETQKGEPYGWEKELLMTETALQAKEYMKQHGFPTS